MRRLAVPPFLLVATVLSLAACKGERAKLEQLVPDGATGMMSVDTKGLVQSALWGKLETITDTVGEGKAKAVLDELRDGCKLDFEQAESMVMGFDAFSQSVMGALRMPNVGTPEALRCLDALVVKQGGKSLWTVGEEGGKATVTVEGGEVQGWALDADTLVISSKGWSSAVQARMKGESKGAVDNSLAQAVALTDTSKHVWVAGEVPSLVAPFLEETPAKGMRQVAGSVHFGDELEVRMTAAFSDEAAAKAMHEQVTPMLDEGKKMAVEQGLPQKAADTLAFTLDGPIVRAELTVDLAPLFESSTQAFTRYMNRSKTAEARINLAKMFDSTSMYFTEERMAPSGELLRACPSDGRAEGETGPTPPLAACTAGSRCTPGGTGDGGYETKLWTESKVWSQIGFELSDPHYFHYNLKWKNDPSGGGSCQFTAQAFGDLDGDGVYSTFERAGAADEDGVNASSGLYIDRELE